MPLRVLQGEPGIGKSRLAREVRREARDGGAMVLDIDCSQRAANTPLGPIARLVKRLIGGAATESPGAEAHVQTWIRALLDRHAATMRSHTSRRCWTSAVHWPTPTRAPTGSVSA